MNTLYPNLLRFSLAGYLLTSIGIEVSTSSMRVTALVASQVLLMVLAGFSLHRDREQMRQNFGWESSKAYYLVVLPSIVGIITIVLYLYNRSKV